MNNIPTLAADIRTIATFAPRTWPKRNVVRGTSGERVRGSTPAKSASAAAAVTSSPTACVELQPATGR
jgi:hypothetical protein